MKAPRLLLITGMLAAGCSPRNEAPALNETAATYGYLQKVGRIRSLINADNKERIPAMIRSRDSVMLGAEGAKMEEYKRTVSAIASAGVDPDALVFTRNFEAILDSYRAVCMDSAELFREMKEANARPKVPVIALPEVITAGTEASQYDTIGTIDALLASLDRIDTSAKAGSVFLQPIVSKVRADRDGLRSAKAEHHTFTLKLKTELMRRHPGMDWASKEILP